MAESNPQNHRSFSQNFMEGLSDPKNLAELGATSWFDIAKSLPSLAADKDLAKQISRLNVATIATFQSIDIAKSLRGRPLRASQVVVATMGG